MANILHIGDVGTAFTYYCRDGEDVVDISTATTTKNLVFQKPGGSTVTKAAYFGDGSGGVDGGAGTAGILAYDFVANDLADGEDGEWAVQGQIVLSSGARSFTVERFHVHPKIG